MKKLARLEGLEPPTYRFEVCRSIQLSYRRALNPGDLTKQFLITTGLHQTSQSLVERLGPGLHPASDVLPSDDPRWILWSNEQKHSSLVSRVLRNYPVRHSCFLRVSDFGPLEIVNKQALTSIPAFPVLCSPARPIPGAQPACVHDRRNSPYTSLVLHPSFAGANSSFTIHLPSPVLAHEFSPCTSTSKGVGFFL
jgi:hypothetical protein